MFLIIVVSVVTLCLAESNTNPTNTTDIQSQFIHLQVTFKADEIRLHLLEDRAQALENSNAELKKQVQQSGWMEPVSIKDK